jgi:hypothetical protein
MTDATLQSQLAALGVYRDAITYAGLMCAHPNTVEAEAAWAIIEAAEAQDSTALRTAMQSAIDQNLSSPLWRLWAADMVAFLDREIAA